MYQPPIKKKTVATIGKNYMAGQTERIPMGPPKMTAKPAIAPKKRPVMMRAPGYGRR